LKVVIIPNDFQYLTVEYLVSFIFKITQIPVDWRS